MDQASQDRREKRRYQRWQHDEWNDQLRQILPPPEPESYIEIRDWTGNIVARRPEITGDLFTYTYDPWRLL